MRLRLAAVLSMLTALPASTASTERPEDFVRRIYARYANDGPGVPMHRPDGAAFYTARLLDAFETDTAVPGGAGVTAEWDPICNCHAFSNLRIGKVTISATRASGITAHVAFINLRFPQAVTLTLARTHDGWRIANVAVKHASTQDIRDVDVESVMALLRQANAHPIRSTDQDAPPKP